MRLLNTSRSLFLGFLLFYAFTGYYFTYILEIFHNDALSRTALAFFTTFGRDPHLAAIGFVWQPFPSLAQIPFLILLKPFGLMLMSGPLVTSLFGALSTVIIYKIGQLIVNEPKNILPLLISIFFGLNPLIILYSAIGTSEMIFMACLVLSSFFLVKYFYSQKQSDILMASSAIAFSFWSRYEALPAFAGSILIIVLYLIFARSNLRKIESTLFQYTLPFIYSVGLWILANWLIMKDPFYFINSPYSNASFTTSFKSTPGLLEGSYNSLINSIRYTINRSLYLAPVIWLIPLIGIPLSKKISHHPKNLLLLGFITFPYLTILLFHSYQLFKGESFGWLRFFIYAIPMSALVAMYLVRRHLILGVLAASFMILGMYTTLYAISDRDLGREEISFFQKLGDNNSQLDFSRTYIDQKAVAAFMDTVPGKVIIDTDKGFAIPLFAKNPERFIITSDIDYLKVIGDYSTHSDWIILPQPVSDDRGQNKIYEFYPGIWEGNAPDITLHKQIEGWRIFKINQSTDIIDIKY